MASFSLSPSVQVTETDLTGIVPAVAVSTGATACELAWGPTGKVTQISTELDLLSRFGKCTDNTYLGWMTASNFLSYTTNLLIIRAETLLQRNAVTSGTAIKVQNDTAYFSNNVNGANSVGQWAARYSGTLGNSVKVSMCDASTFSKTLTGVVSTSITAQIVAPIVAPVVTATTGGSLVAGTYFYVVTGINANGETLKSNEQSVVTTGATSANTVTWAAVTGATGYKVYRGTASGTENAFYVVGAVVTFVDTGAVSTAGAPPLINTTGSNVLTGTGTLFTVETTVGDYIEVVIGGSRIDKKVVSIVSNTLLIVDSVYASVVTSVSAVKRWEFYTFVNAAPVVSNLALSLGATGDGMHIAVVDIDGGISGIPGTLLELFTDVSKAVNATNPGGISNYYKNVINKTSKWVWWMDHPTGAQVIGSGAAFGSQVTQNAVYQNLALSTTYTLTGGVDGFGATDGELELAFSIFSDDQSYDINLLFTAKVSPTVAAYVISNISEVRKDCVTFISPVNVLDNSVIIGSTSTQMDQLVAYRNSLNISSTYAVLDSGFKYQYDKYNDVYRYVPLNGDVAGLCARTDFTNDPWFSPAGLNRGQIKNVTRLAVNPNKSQRDTLFQNAINPVVTFLNNGTVLFGDKTMVARPSDFDSIGVRRMFIIIEKAIATSAKYVLFDQNDDLTRRLFVGMITPYLRDVQGRRGILDFLVDVGPTVNTPEVIQSKSFAANISVKAISGIRNIQLNFIAARNSVSFTELRV